jgi:hypothetical protein
MTTFTNSKQAPRPVQLPQEPPKANPSFQDAEVKKSKRGLKIDNTNSTVPKPDPNPVETFKKSADAAFTRHNDYRQRIEDLSIKFKKIVLDKTLVENKTLLVKDMETSVLKELVQLASDMIEDQNCLLPHGTTALPMLLMKMMLYQRDIINQLAFKIDRLEKVEKIREMATNKSE